MNSIRHCKTLLAAALATTAMFATGTTFAAGNKVDRDAAKERISAQYKADKNACGSMAGNQKDVCEDQAEGKEKVAMAEAEYAYTGKAVDANKILVVKADAAYEVSKEMCDDKGGNAKDVCVAEAKATHTKALADAKSSKKVGAARMDAAEDKRDADYKVAAEKCDSLAGDSRTACINAAKAKFNKS
jgi:hypothetical protein